MTYSIVIDSNILYVDKHYNFKIIEAFNKNLIKLIEDINDNNLNSCVKILLPDIVISELIHQQSKSYYKKINEFDKFTFPDLEVNKKKDYEEVYKSYADVRIKEISEKYKIKIEKIPLPLNISLEKIISMAIKEEAPFEGKDKLSDKGFKDVILWESLINYKKNNNDEQMILCSNDKIFQDKELNSKYKDEFHESIFITTWNVKHPELIKLLCDKVGSDVKLSNETKIIKKLESNSFLEEYLKTQLVDSLNLNLSQNTYKVKNIKSYEIKEMEDLKSSTDYFLLFYVYIEALSVCETVETLTPEQTLTIKKEVTLNLRLTVLSDSINNKVDIVNFEIVGYNN